MLRVLSLGAGVQSSTILLQACQGEERVDAAVFADTGWEPPWVYEQIDFLERQAVQAGIPLYRVGSPTLRADALVNKNEAWMPLFAIDPETGKRSQLKRSCTNNYKIVPIRRKLRELCGGKDVENLVGISLDEYFRVRTSDVKYVTFVYPLVDKRMTRTDCKTWLTEHGYAIPRKSSCIACPFRSPSQWREMQEYPEVWADAVDFDERIRHVRSAREDQGTPRPVFVHAKRIPLSEIDFRNEQDRGQLEMFETDGCGVLCEADAVEAGSL